MGQTCGSAILGLYNSYKSTGTINLTSGNNLSNALALATAYTQIKANKDNSSYRKSFATGLVMSSAGLITNQNSNEFINLLLTCSGLANVSSSNTSQQNQQNEQSSSRQYESATQLPRFFFTNARTRTP